MNIITFQWIWYLSMKWLVCSSRLINPWVCREMLKKQEFPVKTGKVGNYDSIICYVNCCVYCQSSISPSNYNNFFFILQALQLVVQFNFKKSVKYRGLDPKLLFWCIKYTFFVGYLHHESIQYFSIFECYNTPICCFGQLNFLKVRWYYLWTFTVLEKYPIYNKKQFLTLVVYYGMPFYSRACIFTYLRFVKY